MPKSTRRWGGKPEIVFGSYIGSGGSKMITLGFEPKAVLVELDDLYTGLTITPNGHEYIKIKDDGFQAMDNPSDPEGVSANTWGEVHYYIAVK